MRDLDALEDCAPALARGVEHMPSASTALRAGRAPSLVRNERYPLTADCVLSPRTLREAGPSYYSDTPSVLDREGELLPVGTLFRIHRQELKCSTIRQSNTSSFGAVRESPDPGARVRSIRPFGKRHNLLAMRFPLISVSHRPAADERTHRDSAAMVLEVAPRPR